MFQNITRLVVIIVAAALFAGGAGLLPTAQGSVVYFDDFSGSSGDHLNGTVPDIRPGGETWTAHEGVSLLGWKADGSASGTASGQSRNAFLPFTPAPGNIYRLSTGLNPTSGPWFGLGFTGNDGLLNDFWQNDAAPWALLRANRTGGDPLVSRLGPQLAGPVNHSNTDPNRWTGSVDVTIELDTRPALWEVKWFADNELLRTDSYTTNPTISYVGFGSVDATGSVDNFQLTTIQRESFQQGVSPDASYTHDATYFRSNAPTGNFGTADQLIVGTTSGVAADVLRSVLEFDISAIPASHLIDDVSLLLTTYSQGGLDGGGEPGSPTFNVYSYAFDIDETAATWNAPGAGDPNAGGTLGTLLTSASFDVTQTGETVTFGDTPEFRTAVSDALASDGLLRLILAKSDETTVGTHEFARFASNEFATLGHRPELMVTHSIPEPSTFVMFFAGALLLMLRRRRRVV